MRIPLQFLLTILIFSLVYSKDDQPNGGYQSLEDFFTGKVTYKPHTYNLKYEYVTLNRKENPEPIGARIYYALRTDDKKRAWSQRKQGPLAIIKDDCYLFLYPDFGRLHLYQNYSWFTKLKFIGGGAPSSPNSSMPFVTGTRTRVRHYVMNMKTGEVQRLRKKLLREILKEKPEILTEFEAEFFKRSSMIKYLEKFLKATNDISKYN